MRKLFLLEDDLSLISGLTFAFKKQGFALDTARTLAEAEVLWSDRKYDLLVLDVSLPDGSGFDFCQKVRRTSNVPILFLTASDEEMNIIMGLELGGDDYLTKPFKLGVLLSRVNALLRRANASSAGEPVLESGSITVRLLQGQAYKNGILLELTSAEYKLLCFFMQHPNAVLSKEQILDALWDCDGDYIDSITFNYKEGTETVTFGEAVKAEKSSDMSARGAPKKALRKRKAFFMMIAALCECFRFAADFNPSQRLFLFCRRVGEKFIHPSGDATTAANGSEGSFLLPCTAAICYTKEKTEGEALRMTRIAIVEDEAAVREQLAGYVQRYTRQYGTQFEVTMFTDGVEILEDYRPVYDIIFLDVEMQHLDGMETARRIRELDSDVLLIFITNMAQYAIKGYAVGALDYVLKPVPYFAFSQQLQKAVNQLAKRTRHYLAVPVDGGLRRLDAATIYYIESEGHRVHFYTEDGDFSAPGALKALEEKLAGRLFARCNNGYLVNLAQVSGVQQNTVQVGPHELQISRPKRRAFLAALADYIGGEGA